MRLERKAGANHSGFVVTVRNFDFYLSSVEIHERLKAGMGWDEMDVSLLFRVLKYHTDCYVKNGFEVLKK